MCLKTVHTPPERSGKKEGETSATLSVSAGRSWANFAGRSRNWWRRSWTSTGFWTPACTRQPTRPSNVYAHADRTPTPRQLRVRLYGGQVDAGTSHGDDVIIPKCGWRQVGCDITGFVSASRTWAFPHIRNVGFILQLVITTPLMNGAVTESSILHFKEAKSA